MTLKMKIEITEHKSKIQNANASPVTSIKKRFRFKHMETAKKDAKIEMRLSGFMTTQNHRHQ